VHGTQREKSFRGELDDRKRAIGGSGMKEARDFQLELTRGKRAQGKTYTDPKRAEESFMANAEQFILTSARIKAGRQSRKNYLPFPALSLIQRPAGGAWFPGVGLSLGADDLAV
jgi:hypothetical protein